MPRAKKLKTLDWLRDAKGHPIEFKDVRMVISDLDNTMYDWTAFSVPTFREAIPRIAETLGVYTPDLYKEMARVLTSRGVEDPFMWEAQKYARNFKGSRDTYSDRISSVYYEILHRNRLRYIGLYPQVRETLVELSENNIIAAVLSDAPLPCARGRITELGIDSLISALVAQKVVEPAISEIVDSLDLRFGRKMVGMFNRVRSEIGFVEEVGAKKPSLDGVKILLDKFKVSPEEVLIVGDSLHADGGLAEALGARYVFASYGADLPGEYKELLAQLNSNTDKRVDPPSGFASSHLIPPIVAQAASFAEVLNHLKGGPKMAATSLSVAHKLVRSA